MLKCFHGRAIMMKGLNRNVIELNRLDSKYFERAVLILRNDCAADEEELINETRKTILNCEPPSFVAASKARFVVSNLISGTVGAFVAALVFFIIARFV